MNLRRVKAVALKELRHITRDRLTFFLVTLIPVILLVLLAYAVTAEIERVPIAVLDMDSSPTSRSFIQQISVGKELAHIGQASSLMEIEELFLRDAIKAAIVIPPGFGRDLGRLSSFPLQVLVDGTEPQSGGFALEHVGRRTESFILDRLEPALVAGGGRAIPLQPVDLRIRSWFNPNLKPRVDLIPGLISLVLGVPGMSVALTIAREREHGTFEQLLATPVGRAELLLGKIMPYVLGGVANVVMTTLIASFLFDVPFRGSFTLYLLLSIPFFFAVLNLGMIIGVFIRSQAAALALSMMAMFLPGFFLTGIFFPIASMPEIVRLEAMALPGTHFAIITRGLYVSGLGIETLWPYAVALVAMGIGFMAIAALFFRKRLA